MSVVVDASMTLAWFFEDERTESVNGVLTFVAQSGAFVPFHWRTEVANTFLMAERRSRVTADFVDRSLKDLESLPLEIDQNSAEVVWGETRRLAAANRLTIYDAIYLELALRTKFPLATLDKQLAKAATDSGVKLMGITQ